LTNGPHPFLGGRPMTSILSYQWCSEKLLSA